MKPLDEARTSPASEAPTPSADEAERALCLQCLAPNVPTAHFCGECGAPLSSYAATAPFESLLAEGHAWRRATGNPRRLVVVLGMWLLFAPMVAGSVWLLAMGQQASVQAWVAAAFLLPVSVVVLWKTTRNYVTRGGRLEKAHETARGLGGASHGVGPPDGSGARLNTGADPSKLKP